jgi:hypothetical protein
VNTLLKGTGLGVENGYTCNVGYFDY